MSNPRTRKADRYGRQDILKILLELDRLRRITTERRIADVRADRAARMRAWLCEYIEHVEPAPGQLPDTVLGHYYGDLNLLKASRMATTTLRITGIERLPDGARLITASGPIKGALKKGLRKLGDIALTQMRNRGLGPAGEIRSARIENGIARIVARISSAVAAMKVEHRVYPAIDVTHDGNGEIYSVDLVDRPGGDVLAKRGLSVLSRLFVKESEVKKSKDKMVKALIEAPLRPDSSDPVEREFAKAAFLTLYNASLRKGPVDDMASVTNVPTPPHNPSDPGARTTSPLPPPQPGPGRGPEAVPIPNTRPLGIGYPSDQNKTR
jgi:hypothetical protein